MAHRNRLIAILVVVAAIVAVLLVRNARQRADRAELEAGLASARVLESVFERTAKLQVATLGGRVQARSTDDGWPKSAQVTRARFSVVYTIDLRGIDASSMRWNAKERIMTVRIPGVVAGQPAIDMANADTKQSGMWISRGAGQRLQKVAAARLNAAAADAADDPQRIEQAQQAARTAVGNLIAAPLTAAGLGTVKVVVRLPGESKPATLTDEQWDVSRSLDEIYRDIVGA